jgi:hypothetical protein
LQGTCKANLLMGRVAAPRRPDAAARRPYLSLRGFLLCSAARPEIMSECLITFTKRSK